MIILEEIVAKLRDYPEVRYIVAPDSITVYPLRDDGFEVSLHIEEQAPILNLTVFFNGWHEEFSNADDALNCFAMGLTKDCRLKEWSRGEKAYKWSLEILQGGEWETYSTTALFFAPYWRTKNERYLQNDLVK